nr:hypothetical protein [uncultured Bacteroides sp.]
MGQIIQNFYVQRLFLFLLLAFTTFEYFFRSDTPIIILSIFIVIVCFKKIFILARQFNVVIFLFFILFLFQALFLPGYSIYGVFNRLLYFITYIYIGFLLKDNFKNSFLFIMTFIAISSTVIFFLSQIPQINDYLVNVVCPNFPSLNNKTAIQEGGGVNFVIYNFQRNATSLSSIGFLFRNSGPFWEPGLFAVFLNLALFINIIFNRNNIYLTVLFIVAIFTTFSAGGLLSLLFVLFSYVNLKGKNNIIQYILFIALICYFGALMSGLDFVGIKLMDQLNNASIGSDESRFGAILTQLRMIEDSPIIGGMQVSNYTNSGTLASGLFFPLVSFGLPIGIMYYIMLHRACVNFSNKNGASKIAGSLLFALLLIMSISQTILLMAIFMVFIFSNLLNGKIKI